jgi:hypothetical protein
MFGTAVHAQLERWLREGVKPDDTPAGRTAAQGLQWLPHPDTRLLLEQKFVFAVTDEISAGGIIDCLVPPEIGNEVIVVDHKSTSDLRWAKTEEQLAEVELKASLLDFDEADSLAFERGEIGRAHV